MSKFLVVAIRFLGDRYHGRTENGREPEWPPSPLRLFQAILAGVASRWHDVAIRDQEVPAFEWFETLEPPQIIAPKVHSGIPILTYVRENLSDKDTEKRDAKFARPSLFCGEPKLIYYWSIRPQQEEMAKIIARCAHRCRALGWGIDLAIGCGTILEQEPECKWAEKWLPMSSDNERVRLRVPRKKTQYGQIGTVQDLISRFAASLDRIPDDGRNPVPPLSAFRVIGYRRATDPVSRPSVVFELRDDDDSFFCYHQEKMIHIAGMVRHLAIDAMTNSLPDGVGKDWIETYVAGHVRSGAIEHRQFSYLPLPSIGHRHTDPSVRRVMIAAPVGDDRLLHHLAMRLDRRQLKPAPRTKLDPPPTLVQISKDNVTRCYTQPASNWASVTPVILPGHDDHKPEKTRKLIESALQQSGIDQSCEFDWSAFSHFPKSLSAHKYDRHKRPTGYIRPDHLLSQTAVHLKLRFNDGLKVPGPLVIGAGRHCGFGLMAGVDQ